MTSSLTFGYFAQEETTRAASERLLRHRGPAVVFEDEPGQHGRRVARRALNPALDDECDE